MNGMQDDDVLAGRRDYGSGREAAGFADDRDLGSERVRSRSIQGWRKSR